VGNLFGAFVWKSFKIEKNSLEILLLSICEVFLSGVTVPRAETSLILFLKGKGQRDNVHRRTGREDPEGE
jgi:hypothetical protein